MITSNLSLRCPNQVQNLKLLRLTVLDTMHLQENILLNFVLDLEVKVT